MKQLFFIAAMLISIASTAQSQTCATVTQLSTTYTTGQVSFRLTRKDCGDDNSKHRSRVWVFVDYRTVNANGSKGAWTRATINGEPGTFITGNASAETVTLTLGGVPDKFDWCAFASDYPPNATYVGTDKVTFKGTPPFYVTYAGNPNTVGTFYEKTNQTLTGTAASLTDATYNPDGFITPATVAVSGCNGATFTLTSAGFANPTTYSVGGKIWSAPVTATPCRSKTSVQNSNSATDCRGCASCVGDLFTWCMVMTYANILCPSPWRVPTIAELGVITYANTGLLGPSYGTADRCGTGGVDLPNSYTQLLYSGTINGGVGGNGFYRQVCGSRCDWNGANEARCYAIGLRCVQ